MTINRRVLRPFLLLLGVIIASLIAIQFILFSGSKIREVYQNTKLENTSVIDNYLNPLITLYGDFH
ncbi:hypothetical protein AB9P05_20370 [Roseivirga sp. BDSF3-8]|uniref:hypothetical protein n=1 Tax=Roseivirga sp. BDSF3-8 TaxID=3241598 RepID=UPI003531D098